jgi:hypothetical protein
VSEFLAKCFQHMTAAVFDVPHPESWGDVRRIVDEVEGDTLHDAVWSEWSDRLESPPKGLEAAIDDKCDGFNTHSLTFQIFNWESEADLASAYEWCVQQIQDAYDAVCRRHCVSASTVDRVPTLTDLPDYGDHMTAEEFRSCVSSGLFIDYDGHGVLTTGDQASDIDIHPSQVEGFEWPDWATHVVWFNK